MKNLKQIFFCGEKLLNSTVKELFVRFPDLKIVNFYGPTECTFAVTSTIINKDEDKLYAVRCESPLILGIGEKEYFVTSDISAILNYTNKYVLYKL